MLESIQKIQVENSVDLIISQIKDLINSGQLKAGEKLPAERKLAKKLGVSRTQIRAAITKLECFGIVKVQPQSGTLFNGTGLSLLEGLVADIIKLDDPAFRSLVETRVLLEKEAVRLAALHRTAEDIIALEKALVSYENKLEGGNDVVDEDLHFHLTIAAASKNTVLKSLMAIITPDIVKSFREHKVCTDANNQKIIKEHRNILRTIKEQNTEEAIEAMKEHLQGSVEFAAALEEK